MHTAQEAWKILPQGEAHAEGHAPAFRAKKQIALFREVCTWRAQGLSRFQVVPAIAIKSNPDNKNVEFSYFKHRDWNLGEIEHGEYVAETFSSLLYVLMTTAP